VRLKVCASTTSMRLSASQIKRVAHMSQRLGRYLRLLLDKKAERVLRTYRLESGDAARAPLGATLLEWTCIPSQESAAGLRSGIKVAKPLGGL
jgi:hypothetical protein